MKFSVIWRPTVLKALVDYYTDTLKAGADPTPIETAAARIDTLLANNPHSAGESRDENKRILFEPPLVVDFEILDSEGVVFITAVRYLPKPRISD